MNHWAFITAAYALTLAASAAVAFASWRAMRRAEKAAEQLKRS
ncbi:heme exporter protein CcmD [Sphingomonas cannabina]|nr:heme exporter protein CcmD [Sphingomonas cannabina]UIJ44299.1 heme exporter protein CcmD [Sphingomonas cannabina]